MIKHASYWLALGDVGMEEISAEAQGNTDVGALGVPAPPTVFHEMCSRRSWQSETDRQDQGQVDLS